MRAPLRPPPGGRARDHPRRSGGGGDLFGFLLYRVGELAVTRSLTVEYLRPVLLGTDYEFTARVRDHAGRRLHVDAEAVDQVGNKVATSHATFIVVDLQHFEQGTATTGP
jgi:acyl-CoA thioesterase FadM